MPGTSTSDLARALREARNSAALNHRNVVSIYDAVEDGDHNWLVMEYVPSRNLSEMVAEEGPLSPERVVWIGAQAADGLAAAHERGTMHRDVKPGNILVADDDLVKITDFGIARTHGDAQLTRSGIVTGTPAYFAPELARGKEPTVAVDVWALGASLYAAVEGRLPYPDQTNAIALLTQIADGPPRPPERADFLAEPIARMMDPDPSTRWTMSDVAHTLHRLHDQHGIRGSGPSTVSLTAPFAAAAAATTTAPTEPEPETETTPKPEPEPETEPETDDGPPTEATPGPETDDGPPTEATPGPDPEPTGSPPLPLVAADPAPAPDEPSRGGDRRYALAAVVLLVALAAAGAYLLHNRDDGNAPVANKPAGSASTGSGDSGSSGKGKSDNPASPTPKQSSPTKKTGTAGQPAQFVDDYYALLPSDTKTAWSLLSPTRQGQVGSYGNYTGFWRTISQVRVDGTTVVEEGVVDVRLTYTSARGTESETRRVRLEKSGDSFVIAADQVI